NHPHEAVRRRIVDVPIQLFSVLAVVALRPGHAEKALLQNRITPIPKREGKAEPLLEIGDSADPILAPAICARPRVLMWEIIPPVTIGAVIFAHGAPCSLAEIRSPKIPVLSQAIILCDAILLGVHPNAVQS